jgi:hypothetical protein
MNPLLDDPSVVQRILDHIDHRTTASPHAPASSTAPRVR